MHRLRLPVHAALPACKPERPCREVRSRSACVDIRPAAIEKMNAQKNLLAVRDGKQAAGHALLVPVAVFALTCLLLTPGALAGFRLLRLAFPLRLLAPRVFVSLWHDRYSSCEWNDDSERGVRLQTRSPA